MCVVPKNEKVRRVNKMRRVVRKSYLSSAEESDLETKLLAISFATDFKRKSSEENLHAHVLINVKC